MTFRRIEKVEQWRELAEQQLTDSEVDAVTPDVVLALIAVESMGRDTAHRHGSQFYGLLQMGRYAALDVGMCDQGRHTAKPLSGNGVAAIAAFVAYVNRYASRVWSPDSVAVLWKGGPGTAKAVLDAVEDGTEFDEAVSLAEAGELDNTPIGNLGEYVRRFRGYLAVYSERD